ncbi:MAG: polysaccharide deacetylase family protein [Hyphomicrobiales bacterium]
MRRFLAILSATIPLMAPAAPARADALAACWTPAELTASPAERAIRKGDPAARVPMPDISADSAPRSPVLGNIRRVDLPAGVKLVALTFDLCETANEVAGYDGAVVEALRAADAHATFFAGGHWMATHPERTAQLMADPRFEIGTHSWSHRNLRKASKETLRARSAPR